jgi:hypothetical protein
MTSPYIPAFKFCTLPHHPCIGIFCIYCSLFLVFSSLLLIVFPDLQGIACAARLGGYLAQTVWYLYHVYAFDKGCLFASYKARVNTNGEMVCLLDYKHSEARRRRPKFYASGLNGSTSILLNCSSLWGPRTSSVSKGS